MAYTNAATEFYNGEWILRIVFSVAWLRNSIISSYNGIVLQSLDWSILQEMAIGYHANSLAS